MKRILADEGRWIAASVSLTLGLLSLMVYALGQSPLEIFGLIGTQLLADPYGIGQILYKATTLIFTGLGCALAFRCGLFNIGAEGQLYVGAFLMTFVGSYLGNVSPLIAIPICLLAAAAGGGAWALLPAYLKAKRGAHEVITTMMMNFIALAGVNYLISAYFHMPETVHTAELPASVALAALPLRQSAANVSLFIALVLVAGVYYLLWRTPLGFELRAVGCNATAARTSGIAVDKRIFQILLFSGALSGMAGVNFILGYKHYFELGFASSAGFMGIAVALVAKNQPLGVIFAALLFAGLAQAGTTLNRQIPKELFEIMQGAVIFIVVICQNRLGRRE